MPVHGDGDSSGGFPDLLGYAGGEEVAHGSGDRDVSGAGEIDRAVEILRRGGLVAFPTETVYGLGADATNPEAVARIYEVKERPTGHPVIVHIGDIGQW